MITTVKKLIEYLETLPEDKPMVAVIPPDSTWFVESSSIVFVDNNNRRHDFTYSNYQLD